MLFLKLSFLALISTVCFAQLVDNSTIGTGPTSEFQKCMQPNLALAKERDGLMAIVAGPGPNNTPAKDAAGRRASELALQMSQRATRCLEEKKDREAKARKEAEEKANAALKAAEDARKQKADREAKESQERLRNYQAARKAAEEKIAALGEKNKELEKQLSEITKKNTVNSTHEDGKTTQSFLDQYGEGATLRAELAKNRTEIEKLKKGIQSAGAPQGSLGTQ